MEGAGPQTGRPERCVGVGGHGLADFVSQLDRASSRLLAVSGLYDYPSFRRLLACPVGDFSIARRLMNSCKAAWLIRVSELEGSVPFPSLRGTKPNRS